MVQERLKLRPRLGGHWRVGIQAVRYAFKLQGMHSSCRVLIQDVGVSFSLCVGVCWLPVAQ